MRFDLCVVSVVVMLSVGLALRAAQAGTKSNELTQDDRRLLVLENAAARIAVWPDAGGAIVEYLDKASGVDLVAGQVRIGAATGGWKDMTAPQGTAASSELFGAQKYQGKLTTQDGQPAIEVTCTHSGLRIDRTMQLRDDTAELFVTIVTTNVSDQPRSLWARWHPYIKLGDALAKTSVIIAPEGPQEASQPAGWRKIFIGQGWEQHFLVKHGFWLAADYVSGQGLWMTFDKTDVPCLGTWTDYKFSDHPRRSHFVAELYPRPTLIAPGQTSRQKLSYLPFTLKDDARNMSLGADRRQQLPFGPQALKLHASNSLFALLVTYAMLSMSPAPAMAQTAPDPARTHLIFQSAYLRETTDRPWQLRISGNIKSLPGCYLIMHDASNRMLLRKAIPSGKIALETPVVFDVPADGITGDYRIVIIGTESDILELNLPLTDLPLEVYGLTRFAARTDARLLFRVPEGVAQLTFSAYTGSVRILENGEPILDVKEQGTLTNRNYVATAPVKPGAEYQLVPHSAFYFGVVQGVYLTPDLRRWFLPDAKLNEVKWWQLKP